jgi:hypothetical protein
MRCCSSPCCYCSSSSSQGPPAAPPAGPPAPKSKELSTSTEACLCRRCRRGHPKKTRTIHPPSPGLPFRHALSPDDISKQTACCSPSSAVASSLVCVCVFISAGLSTKLFAWGGGDMGGHVLRERTSRGLCGLVCPSRTSERGGEGDCVKEGGASVEILGCPGPTVP